MQLEEDNPREDDWLRHWVGMAFRAHSLRGEKKPWKIGLAVSGGSDSMAMLHLFASCAEDQNYILSVATVDHGLRPEAKDEAAFVAETCATLRLPHQTLKWTDWDGKGNLQAKAREARYGLLVGWAKELGLETVVLGHTQDDQAETFLARLARGSGLDGLAGMADKFKSDGVEFARPCLSLERDMLRRYLKRHDHKWHDDPSNEDNRYQRVQIRDALKVLEPLGIEPHQLAMTATRLQSSRNALRDLTERSARDIVSFEAGEVVMTWENFVTGNSEISRRLLAEILRWIGNTSYPPRADAVGDMHQTIIRRKTGTLNGCLVTATQQEVRIGREFQKVANLVCATDQCWDNRWKLEGPHESNLEIRALGPVGLPQCPDWRLVGLPRTSLLASPAIWSGDELIAAPLAKLNPEWTATLVRGANEFFSSIVPH